MPPLRALLQPPPTAPAGPPRPQGPLSIADRLITLAQGLMGVNQPEPTDFQTPQDFGQADYWHGLGEMLGLAPALVAPMMAIKAYHGSPHDFSSFDLSKIGTGEGAQAYGHGLYFAENPKVAADYRNSLVRDRHVELDAFDPDKGYGALDPKTKQIKWFANEKDAKEFKRDFMGAQYEVNIHASPDELLDWDKPLSQQSPKVQEALKTLWERKGGTLEGRTLPPFAAHSEADGQSAYNAIATSFGSKTGSDKDLQQAASEALKSVGIKGIQYLDQGSRVGYNAGPVVKVVNQPHPRGNWLAQFYAKDGTALNGDRFSSEEAANAWVKKQREGTHNFVIFDDSPKVLEIAKKYGLALPAAASLYKWQQSQKGVE